MSTNLYQKLCSNDKIFQWKWRFFSMVFVDNSDQYFFTFTKDSFRFVCFWFVLFDSKIFFFVRNSSFLSGFLQSSSKLFYLFENKCSIVVFCECRIFCVNKTCAGSVLTKKVGLKFLPRGMVLQKRCSIREEEKRR